MSADTVGDGEELEAPTILTFSVSPTTPAVGDEVSIDLAFSATVTYALVVEDIDGNEVTRFDGEAEDPSALTWTPSTAGEYSIVIDIENAGGSTGDALDIEVTEAEAEEEPEPEPEEVPGAFVSGTLSRVGGGSTLTTGDTVTLSVMTSGDVESVEATVMGVQQTLSFSGSQWTNTWTVSGSFDDTLGATISGDGGEFSGSVTSSLTYATPVGITAPTANEVVSWTTTMTLSGDDLECSIDGVTFDACESGDRILSLSNGATIPDGELELTVRNDTGSVTRTVVKDTTAPEKVSVSLQDQALRVSTTTSIVLTLSEAPRASAVRARLTPSIAVSVSVSGAVVTVTPALSLDEGEEYTLVVYGISDEVGNAGAAITQTFRTNAPGLLSLEAGWNLISLPLISDPVNPASLFGDAVEEVWTYNTGDSAAVDGWLTYTHGAPEGVNTLSTLEPGRAYWVKVNGSVTVSIIEGSLDGPETPPSITLAPGWNLVGVFGLPGDEEQSVHDALSSLLDEHGEETWSAIWRLEEGVLNEPASLVPGEGYWIYMTEERTYTMV